MTARLEQVAPALRQRLVLLAMTGAVAAFGLSLAIERERSVELLVPTGSIRVALADNPQRRAAGLSGRDHAPHDGMLLLWDTPGHHSIWMHEMRFALDLIWLDSHGRVLNVLTNVPPCTHEPCVVYEPEGSAKAIAVLELPAGRSVERRLAIGAIVRGGAF